MHIEPGIVHGAKMALAYGTAAGAGGYALKLAWEDAKANGVPALALRSALAAIGTLVFFEVLPHVAVGVSEVHFILGTTLFLLLGLAPAAIGLAAGLLVQGLFLAPADLPMFFVNVTTLLVPLFAVFALARRVVAPGTAYVDLSYAQTLKLSAAYQGGVVAWVAFWAVWGQGTGADNLASIASFGAAYMLVVAVEPLADLAVLWAAKSMRGLRGSPLVASRLYGTA